MPNVIQHTTYPNAEIIVADNASTDDSVAFLQTNFPTIRLVINPINTGYAGGYNDALQQIESDYYVLLNSDVEVTPNWIENVLTFMSRDKQMVACQPKILSYSERNKFEYAGAAGGFIDKYGYPFCRGRIFDTCETDEGQYNQSGEIFWASGACLFIKAEIFHKTGGFDADFFAHMEEIDFCWRAKNYGYSIMYIPESEVFHVGGGTLPQSNPFKTYLNFRNNLFLLYKNLPSKKLQYTVFIRKIFDGIACVKFLFSGQWGDCKAVIKAHIDYYASVKNLRAKRKKLNHTLSTVSYAQLYKHSIVWEYFIRKKNKITL